MNDERTQAVVRRITRETGKFQCTPRALLGRERFTTGLLAFASTLAAVTASICVDITRITFEALSAGAPAPAVYILGTIGALLTAGIGGGSLYYARATLSAHDRAVETGRALRSHAARAAGLLS